MNFTKIFKVLIPLVLLISSCSKDDDPVNNNPGTFDCPFLAVGNKWTYNYSQFFNSGTLIMEIISTSNNEYVVHQTYDANAPGVQYWFTNGDLLYSYVQGESKSNAGAIYKCGAVVGDKWQAPSSSQQGGVVYYEVVEVGVPITTVFGSFNCVKIQVTFSYAINTQYNYWTDADGLIFQTGFAALDLTDKNF